MRSYLLCLYCVPGLAGAVREKHVGEAATLSASNLTRNRVQRAFSRTRRSDFPEGLSAAHVPPAEFSIRSITEGGPTAGSPYDHATCWGNRSAVVTVLTLAAGLPDSYMSLLRWNRLSYAASHNLEYCEYTHVLDPTREATWSKISAMLYLLEDPVGPAARVQWLDADALIMNKNLSIVEILADWSDKDVVFSTDFPALRNEVLRSSINAGSMHVRNSPWTRALLRRLFTTEAGRRSTTLALFDGNYDCEQTAFLQLRAEDPSAFDSNTGMVPWNTMNVLGFPHYCEGDFILHATGGGTRFLSFFSGHYLPKWGIVNKFDRLQEFMLHQETKRASNHMHSGVSDETSRCGGFIPARTDSIFAHGALLTIGVVIAAAVVAATCCKSRHLVHERLVGKI